MDWLEPFEGDIGEDDDSERFPFRIELIDEPHDKKRYTPLTQFFLLLSSQDVHEPGVTSLKIKDGQITDEELCEIILHFEERKTVTFEGKPIEVLLSRPNKDSLGHIKSHPLNPVIQCLFGETIQPKRDSAAQPYRVLPSKLKSFEDAEFDKVLSYLASRKSSISFQILNWDLNDSLKESYALRYLSHHTQTLCLWVNESKRVVFMEMEF